MNFQAKVKELTEEKLVRLALPLTVGSNTDKQFLALKRQGTVKYHLSKQVHPRIRMYEILNRLNN